MRSLYSVRQEEDLTMDDSPIKAIIAPASHNAVAYVLRGEWVAACPRDECTNVEFLDPARHPRTRCTKQTFYCTYCQMMTAIRWPHNADEIMEPLNRRPIPRTRNWYPKDHPEAVAYRIEHGQSVADLWAENKDHGVT